MNPVDALSRASSTFLDVLVHVRDDQLGLSTPCSEWNVAALVNHVTMGDEMAVDLLNGATQEEARAMVDAEFGGDDPITACRASVGAQMIRVQAVTDWSAIVHHVIGDVPASELLKFRIGDLTLHAWDLATAVGADATLPADLAAVVYEDMLPLVPLLPQIGVFGDGPTGTVGDDADMQQRLLDLAGRRP